MKSTTASLTLIALASTVIAQPHGHHHPARAVHQHGHQDQKRELVTEWDIEWVTETVTEYIEASTTRIVYPTSDTPATTLATVLTSPTPGDFLEKTSSSPSSTPLVVAPVETTSSSSSVYVAPPAPTTTASSSSSIISSEVYVAPETTSIRTPVDTPTPTSTPIVEAPTTAETSAVAAAATTAASSSSSESGSTVSVSTDISVILGTDYQTGDLTYYDLGLGACGIDNGGEDETANIVAMSSATMGSQSNGNPMCGKTIKIYNEATGKTATGTIQDKCPGCAAGSIDVSKKLFEELADLSEGRLQISWNWA